MLSCLGCILHVKPFCISLYTSFDNFSSHHKHQHHYTNNRMVVQNVREATVHVGR